MKRSASDAFVNLMRRNFIFLARDSRCGCLGPVGGREEAVLILSLEDVEATVLRRVKMLVAVLITVLERLGGAMAGFELNKANLSKLMKCNSTRPSFFLFCTESKSIQENLNSRWRPGSSYVAKKVKVKIGISTEVSTEDLQIFKCSRVAKSP